MARIGMKYLVGAKVATAEYGSLPTYSKGFQIGRAIEADVSITQNDNNLYADNRVVNVDKSFQSGTITLGVDEFGSGTEASQQEVEAMLTGAKAVTIEGEECIDLGESPKLNNCGVGWYTDGRYPDTEAKYYEPIWYYQVTFGGVGDESVTTKQGNITWNTPTVDGVIKPVAGVDSEVNIRRKTRFATEGEAIAWLNIMANIDFTEAQLNAANANELYTLCKKYDITSVTVDTETVVISSAASITATTKPAVVTAILAAQEASNTPASNESIVDNG